jgi:phosphoglycolate phosphatase-like HAD superfamily hydrolase
MKIDPLPSWNDTNARKAIISFVEKVTTPGGADYIAPAERIATFDNDGTLWCEQPVYVQAFYVTDRIKALAPQHPDWTTLEPYSSVLRDDPAGVVKGGARAVEELMMSTHAGMTADEYSKIVADWLLTARHPKFRRPYTELIYQPMLELLQYLRANGFKTFIVSGGGVEFIRVFAEKTYGIPPEQIIGSSIKTKYELHDGKPSIFRLPEIDFIDDGPGKPVGIAKFIGRRPVMAFGNSDGDLQMLQYTTAGEGPRFALLVHHTDDTREYAYDRKSHIGKLDKALDEATTAKWTVVDMKEDWKTIFPPEVKEKK